jgi:carboxyl-terminal processing protease
MLTMSRRARLVVLFTTVPIVAFTMVGGFLGQAVAREGAYRHLRVFEDVVSLIANNYVEDIDLDGVMKGALRGLAGGLDADSTFLSAEDVAQIESGAPLPDGQLGIEVTSQYYIQIIAARDESPAARAGLVPGDYIRAINGKTTRLLSAIESNRLLRGEPGSTVQLSLLRGSTQEPYDIELTRERLSPLPIDGRVMDGTVGYVRVGTFRQGVADEIEAEVARLVAAGATSLLIDVRDAAGGEFEEGIAAARLFVASGTLLRRVEHGEQEILVEATAGADAISERVVLLTNPGTTRGAELFVASLTSTNRADTVGQRTGGRASLQKLVKLPDDTGLWLSWARYLDATGEPIHRFGVQPTVEVELPFVELGEPAAADDLILERGLEHLRAS